jgi:predicted nucleic acid-binding protein
VANSFYLDASALAKRYVPETGSALVDAILDARPARRVFVLNVGAGEVVSIFVRKRNAGLLSAPDLRQALARFDAEIIAATHVTKLPVTNLLARSSIPLIVAHSINSTDADRVPVWSGPRPPATLAKD